LKELAKYNIDIFRLSNKQHEYEYEVGDAFFENIGQSYIEKGKLDVKVKLDKSETMITALFHIKGEVELTCDRSLEKFNYPIDAQNRIIFKFGEENRELSDEIFEISRNAQQLEMAQHIFDFIGLAIPMKKLHPRFVEEEDELEDDDEVEGVLIYTSSDDNSSDESDPEKKSEDDVDPRWQILKNLKKNNN
jgi:uncharacterized protein